MSGPKKDLSSEQDTGERYCNKCGYFGPDMMHNRPNGNGRCGYISCLAASLKAPAGQKAEPSASSRIAGQEKKE